MVDADSLIDNSGPNFQVTVINKHDITQQGVAAVTTLAEEVHRIHGLNPSSPVTVTTNSRVAGDISQDITGDGVTTSTVTRT